MSGFMHEHPGIRLGGSETGEGQPILEDHSLTPESLPLRDAASPPGLNSLDPGDLDFLFTHYAGLVLGIARRVLGNNSEAEEVLQEVFFYVYERSQLFDPAKGSRKAWLVQIALSRSLDRKSYLLRRGFYSGVDIGSLADSLASKIDLEHETESRLNQRNLERAFAELPEKQRRTIDCFYFRGLELTEISALLHESLGNVRHHLYRGLKRLRKNAHVLALRQK
jgi:RNA polymerase sigma-70 factor (ECF subfamily)